MLTSCRNDFSFTLRVDPWREWIISSSVYPNDCLILLWQLLQYLYWEQTYNHQIHSKCWALVESCVVELRPSRLPWVVQYSCSQSGGHQSIIYSGFCSNKVEVMDESPSLVCGTVAATVTPAWHFKTICCICKGPCGHCPGSAGRSLYCKKPVQSQSCCFNLPDSSGCLCHCQYSLIILHFPLNHKSFINIFNRTDGCCSDSRCDL